MSEPRPDACILNQEPGAWAFEPLAEALSAALGVPVSPVPMGFNYVLSASASASDLPPDLASFIPLRSIEIAADKRVLAEVFAAAGVPTPRTLLAPDYEAVQRIVAEHPGREWCLKYPTGCGASGHRSVAAGDPEPRDWPTPFVVQEFIRLERPEVFRIYAAGGESFGWIVRRYAGEGGSPWVAHARGARYGRCGEAPDEAREVGERAMRAAGVFDSFGCADLLRTPAGRWLALEVGTDGLHNHVDRELDDPELEAEIARRIAAAFKKAHERWSTVAP